MELQQRPFLQQVAQRILEKWPGETLRNTTLMLPTSRAFLHLSRWLHTLHPDALLLPKRTSCGGIMEEISARRTVEPLQLLPTLHTIYRQHTGSRETLEEFFFWGNTLLHDFDQIDKYRIDPHRLLVNQMDIKALDAHYDYLTPEQKELLSHLFDLFSQEAASPLPLPSEDIPPLRQKYLTLWNCLPGIYDDLQAHMQKEGIGYEGHIFRTAAERLLSTPDCLLGCPSHSPGWAIAGFNALNPCEQVLFSTLKQQADTLFFWKLPRSQQGPSESIAGLFTRRNLKQYPNSLPRDLPESSGKEPPSPLPVRLVSVPYSTAQVEALNRELKLLLGQGASPDSIAIVLTDESLLLPILQLLPRQHGGDRLQYNVTMGYPIRHTVAYTLLESTLSLLIRLEGKEGHSMPYQPLMELLNHPLLRIFPQIQSCLQSLTSPLQPPIPLESLSPCQELQEALRKGRRGEALETLISLLEWVHDSLSDPTRQSPQALESSYLPSDLLLEFIATAHATLIQLQKALITAGIAPTAPLLRALLPQAFREVKADFLGDPLNAVQIMGFLETRTLDFKYAIVVSCNERFLPGNLTPPTSFILPNLAFAFGLPSPRERTAMYSYYFETLLNTCQSVSLLHVENPALPGGLGETSRFLRKLPLFPELYCVTSLRLTLPITAATPPPPITPQAQQTVRFIEQYTRPPSRGNALEPSLPTLGPRRALSPTAFIAYHKCPHLFQLSYISGIRPPDDPLLPELSPLEVGNIAHQTLQALYSPLVGERVTPERLKALMARVDSALLTAFHHVRYAEAPQPRATITPPERINLEIAKRMVLNTIEIDQRRAEANPYQLVALEREIEAIFPLPDGTSVPIKGYIDRIERTTPHDLTILDYKTGRHDPSKYTLRSLEALLAPGRPSHDYLVQILLYCAMVRQRDREGTIARITPRLWLIESNPQAYTPRVLMDREPLIDAIPLLEEFMRYVTGRLQEIFTPANPFTPSPRPGACDHCDYRTLCPRGQTLL